MQKQTQSSSSSSAAHNVRVISDDVDDDEISALNVMMQREWNTVDFTGKCKLFFQTSHCCLTSITLQTQFPYHSLKHTSTSYSYHTYRSLVKVRESSHVNPWHTSTCRERIPRIQNSSSTTVVRRSNGTGQTCERKTENKK